MAMKCSQNRREKKDCIRSGRIVLQKRSFLDIRDGSEIKDTTPGYKKATLIT